MGIGTTQKYMCRYSLDEAFLMSTHKTSVGIGTQKDICCRYSLDEAFPMSTHKTSLGEEISSENLNQTA